MASIKFDFAAWRQRMGFTVEQAAGALDVSRSFYYRLEKAGECRKLYAWAAYGMEAAGTKGTV